MDKLVKKVSEKSDSARMSLERETQTPELAKEGVMDAKDEYDEEVEAGEEMSVDGKGENADRLRETESVTPTPGSVVMNSVVPARCPSPRKSCQRPLPPSPSLLTVQSPLPQISTVVHSNMVSCSKSVLRVLCCS